MEADKTKCDPGPFDLEEYFWDKKMTSIVVGNQSVFAIESSITEANEELGQRALGYFTIYLNGIQYGVRSPDATMLACSLDAVRKRISRRGTHIATFGFEPNAAKIVEAYLAVGYGETHPRKKYFGMSAQDFKDAILANEIVWAPDGDEAFDDASHILQFDQGVVVRLIGCKQVCGQEGATSIHMLTDVLVNADLFYDLLNDWQNAFEKEWRTAKKISLLSRPTKPRPES